MEAIEIDIVDNAKPEHSNKIWLAEMYSPDGKRWFRITSARSKRAAVAAVMGYATRYQGDMTGLKWRVSHVSW